MANLNTADLTAAATQAAPERRLGRTGPALTPLETETRSALPTAEAARHLGRAAQTLRLWACEQNGPLRPIRVHGRLMWPVSAIKRLLGVSQ